MRENPWIEYTRRKQELPPDLTPEEYEEACNRIADELGI